MSLPHAMAVLGLAFGTSLLMLIYWLAYYTLKKLIKCDLPRATVALIGSVRRSKWCQLICIARYRGATVRMRQSGWLIAIESIGRRPCSWDQAT